MGSIYPKALTGGVGRIVARQGPGLLIVRFPRVPRTSFRSTSGHAATTSTTVPQINKYMCSLSVLQKISSALLFHFTSLLAAVDELIGLSTARFMNRPLQSTRTSKGFIATKSSIDFYLFLVIIFYNYNYNNPSYSCQDFLNK